MLSADLTNQTAQEYRKGCGAKGGARRGRAWKIVGIIKLPA